MGSFYRSLDKLLSGNLTSFLETRPLENRLLINWLLQTHLIKNLNLGWVAKNQPSTFNRKSS